MINLETIEREINEIEARCDTTYRTCERLAWLYICRDHLKPTDSQSVTATAMVPPSDGSEFLRAASGKRLDDVMDVIDEHLETIRVMFPTTYDNIIRRVRDL